MALPGSQLRTQIPLLVWKFIPVPPCDIRRDIRPAPCECHCFSGSHLRRLRKYPVLCQSYSSTLAKGIVSEDFPVRAQCVSLAVIPYLHYVCSRGNICQHLPHSGLYDIHLLSVLSTKEMSGVLETVVCKLQTNTAIYDGIV